MRQKQKYLSINISSVPKNISNLSYSKYAFRVNSIIYKFSELPVALQQMINILKVYAIKCT